MTEANTQIKDMIDTVVNANTRLIELQWKAGQQAITGLTKLSSDLSEKYHAHLTALTDTSAVEELIEKSKAYQESVIGTVKAFDEDNKARMETLKKDQEELFDSVLDNAISE